MAKKVRRMDPPAKGDDRVPARFDFGIRMAPEGARAPPPPPSTPASSKPKIAAILLIVGGILCLVTSATMIISSGDDDTLDAYIDQAGGEDSGIDRGMLSNVLKMCGVVEIVFGVFAILGGYLALARRRWSLVFVCCILLSVSIGMSGVATVLGIIALVLVWMSKSEFS